MAMVKKIRAYKLAKEMKMSNVQFLDYYHDRYGVHLKSHMTKIDACKICRDDWERKNKTKWSDANDGVYCQTCEM
jgi:hypothetical protein